MRWVLGATLPLIHRNDLVRVQRKLSVRVDGNAEQSGIRLKRVKTGQTQEDEGTVSMDRGKQHIKHSKAQAE